MSATLFWGILFIIVGLSLVLKIIFHIDFSIFRVIVAFFLIYLGIRLYIGKDFSLFPDTDKDNQMVFSEKTIKTVESGKEYNVIFGGAKFDLHDMQIPDSSTIHIKINTIFGGSQIVLNPDIPVHVNSSTVFAGTKMPDGNTSAFGSLNYESDTVKKGRPRLIIETATVFGGLHIK